MLSTGARRRIPPALFEQLRLLSVSSFPQQAVPATQEAANKAGGFLSKLFGGGSNRTSIPLTEPLPDVVLPTPNSPPATPPQTESTTLPNGVKIVSEATYVSN